ncbi:hypothetical protein PIB30_024540 [Stylosanthes scabra]|uniref:Uncharacterized protein n=1 Tax=Stylosanthes scabra TaxID=79078 RepID=A0ABU6RA30_9FABA|nr:hypothetical protein [Stylosanthes scabra]
MLIHSIIRGDEIRAEEIIADNIILITQGLGGKGKLGFPSTIYKLCRATKVKINRKYGGYEECEEGRFITSEVMETVRIPQIALGQHIEHDDEDEPMPQFVPPYVPQNAADDAEFGDQEQDQDQHFEHHYEQPPYIEQPPQIEQPPPNTNSSSNLTRECYDIWAHQQLNPNLVEMPVTKLVKLIYENCDKKRPEFLGCLKLDHEAGSSSQAAPPATPTAAPTSAATATPAPAPAPQHPQDDYYPEQFFQN